MRHGTTHPANRPRSSVSVTASDTFLEAILGAWQEGTLMPKHRQLYEIVRSAILRGDAGPGLQLPSTRACCAALSLGRNTALRAFQQLLDEGYIETRKGQGTFVAAVPPDLVPHGRPQEARARAAASAVSLRGRDILARLAPPSRVRGPLRGDPTSDAVRSAFLPVSDTSAFPWKIWHQLVNRHLRSSDAFRGHPGFDGGDPRLKAALAEHVRLARGVRCSPEQILITSGAQQALLLLALALGNPGDVAWVEEPGHEGTRAAIVAAGLQPVPVPMDGEGLAWHAALPRPRLIFVTPSHQYPLGQVLSMRRRQALLAAASALGAWIVEDDYDSELRHGERPLPSLQGMDAEGRVVYLGTFARVLFHRLRLAYVILPEAMAEPVRRLNTRLFRDAPPTEQGAVADFIAQGYFAAHIRKMRGIYRRRRDKLCAALTARLGEQVQILGGEAGIHLTLRLPAHLDDREVCRALAHAGLDVLPLSDFFAGQPAFPGLILAFGGVDDATLALATFRLCTVLENALHLAAPQ